MRERRSHRTQLQLTRKRSGVMQIPTLIVASLAVVFSTTRVDGCSCCLCGPSISVTLNIQNCLFSPYFNHTTTISMCKRELIYFLQAAADKQNEFKFSADYFPSPLGYFITTINGVKADYAADKTSWRITDGYNNSLTQGVSSYVPYDTQLIIFSLVKG